MAGKSTLSPHSTVATGDNTVTCVLFSTALALPINSTTWKYFNFSNKYGTTLEEADHEDLPFESVLQTWVTLFGKLAGYPKA
nr:hypothetical transcript [Hymenolepis microstoma]